MPIHPAHRILFATLILAGCGDSNPTESDAGAKSDAAVDSGKPDATTRADSGTDAGRPNEQDAATDAGSAVDAAPVGDDEQVVELRFHAQLGEQPIACGSSFESQGSTAQTITLRDLRVFVQDVALVDAAGREVPVKLDTRAPWQNAEVALLDFEDSTGECFSTPETNEQITGVVPKGDYVAVRFSHGVPEKLNHSDPKMFPPPLQTPGMSWNWLLGLRFLKLEVGTADVEGVDAGAAPGSFSLHVGSTGCAGNQNEGTIKCAKPNRSRIELKDFELAKSEIVLDIKPLISGSDLSETIECHSGTAVCDPLFKAVGVSYASGAPSKDQTVFRLK